MHKRIFMKRAFFAIMCLVSPTGLQVPMISARSPTFKTAMNKALFLLYLCCPQMGNHSTKAYVKPKKREKLISPHHRSEQLAAVE